MLFCFTCDWLAGPTGVEPAAYGLRVRRSSLTELRAHLCCFELKIVMKYRGCGFRFNGLLLSVETPPRPLIKQCGWLPFTGSCNEGL